MGGGNMDCLWLWLANVALLLRWQRHVGGGEGTPATQALLSGFIAHMATAYSSKTISNYLNGVWAWHILHSIPWALEWKETDAMLCAAHKVTPDASKRKKHLSYTPALMPPSLHAWPPASMPKVAGSEGEDVYWATQDGDTNPSVALQNHLHLNQPSEVSHFFAYQAKHVCCPLPRRNSWRG
jgi:hypothetical protein